MKKILAVLALSFIALTGLATPAFAWGCNDQGTVCGAHISANKIRPSYYYGGGNYGSNGGCNWNCGGYNTNSYYNNNGGCSWSGCSNYNNNYGGNNNYYGNGGYYNGGGYNGGCGSYCYGGNYSGYGNYGNYYGGGSYGYSSVQVGVGVGFSGGYYSSPQYCTSWGCY